MIVCLVIVCVAISPAFGSVARDRINSCSTDEVSCGDLCVKFDSICDGRKDCLDGSDEANCLTGASSGGLSDDLVLHRSRRQSSQCRKDQWQCRDGTCIDFDGKCDGIVNCPDKSDETHALCRKTKCQPNWFRCTYGACVDGTAPCNGIDECADRSDELLPKCRNETQVSQGQFRCKDGSAIPASDLCDGNPDCPDGSDEEITACAAKTCPSYLFQCAYGACVDQGSDCNGINECADGSDESDELCNRQLPSNPTVTNRPTQSGKCILPPYPEHGTYVVANAPYATPGQRFPSLNLNVTCRQGYGVVGTDIVFCQDGTWSNSIPQCVRFCKLDNNPSVHFHCLVSGSIEGRRVCNAYEPSGTVVRPECNSPNYYSAFTLPFMRCIDGSWDYVAVCSPGLTKNGTNITILIKDTVEVYVNNFLYASGDKYQSANVSIEVVTQKKVEDLTKFDDSTVNPLDYEISEDDWRMGPVQKGSKAASKPIRNSTECGRVTPDGVDLIIDGRPAKRGELPWHVGIYRKTTKPYMQICGGSLISNKVVISAAHCFWNDVSKLQPASMYAVAIGKIYRPWNNDRDVDAQKSDVKEIKIPVRFQGSAANFQDDIAMLILETTFVYHTFVRPVCLDFEVNFDRRQLQPGKLGKVAGWGLTAENGQASQFLKVVELPYVDIEQCITGSPPGFIEYITSDKICAGYGNGTALCKGDSGGGLAFPETERGTERYFLRGIVSTAANNENLCNSNTLTTFTQISKHEHFVKEYL